MISVLNTGFIICLSAAILFLIISVVLFFLFDIKTIFMIRSGRAQAKSIKEMQEANASTGRLMNTKKNQKKTQTRTYDESAAKPAPVAEVKTPAYDDGSGKTEALDNVPDPDGSDETMILSQDQPGFNGGEETTILKAESETTVLSGAAEGGTEILSRIRPQQPVADIYFEIVKKVICCDTEEIIR